MLEINRHLSPPTQYLFSINPISDSYLVSALQSLCLVIVSYVSERNRQLGFLLQRRNRLFENGVTFNLVLSNSTISMGCGSSLERF